MASPKSMFRVILMKAHLRNVILLLFFFAVKVSHAGTIPGSFLIKESSSVNVQSCTTSILQSDFEPFRYRDQRVLLEFTNGLKVELLSARELADQGVHLNLNNYKETDTPGYRPPVFTFNADGTISALFQKTGQKSETIKRTKE